jgi:hypothetical protein
VGRCRARLLGDLFRRAFRDDLAALVAAFGAESITQSAVFDDLRLCSITTTLLPCSTRREDLQELAHVLEMEAVVGSSRM